MVGLLAPCLVRLGVCIGFSGTDLQRPGFTELELFVGSVDESDVL